MGSSSAKKGKRIHHCGDPEQPDRRDQAKVYLGRCGTCPSEKGGRTVARSGEKGKNRESELWSVLFWSHNLRSWTANVRTNGWLSQTKEVSGI